jgi:hypothetical protein
MGSFASIWKVIGRRILTKSFLMMLVSMFLHWSAAIYSGGNFVAATAFESSSLPRKVGDDTEVLSWKKRALLQNSGAGMGMDVSQPETSVVTVNQHGTGDYGTVQEAVDGVPPQNTQRVVIRIFPGIYRCVAT